MIETTPKISVIMGIYNCETTLSAAIECILAQTEQNWELIMCDDGSTDGTYTVADDYKSRFPEKISLLKNEKNHGLSYSLNRCLGIARGSYIARMDGDDLCSSDRFHEELMILETEKDIAIVSTDMECFDENGVWGIVTHPSYPRKYDFLKESPFCHAPCMVRMEAYAAVNGYRENAKFSRVEDYDLWIRMYQKGFRGKNLHEALYQMRDDQDALKRRSFISRLREANIRVEAVKRLKLPLYGYLYSIRPIVVGMLPSSLYRFLHRRKLRTRKTRL